MKQPYIKIILTIFIASLLFYAVFITFNYYNKNLANVEKFGPSSIPDVTVALFYADWCGHCKKYKESKVFDETSKKINADPTLNGKVLFIQYDYDQTKDFANKYNIQSFPSIISIQKSNGPIISTFNDDIYNSDKLISFAKTSLSSVA